MENKEHIRMNKEERRKQIIESAMNIFVDKGYNGTTTAEIAKAANISEVTLFRHFSSKQELFLEVVDPILVNTLKESITASKNLEPLEKLKFILKERIKLISKNHKVIRLVLMESYINPELGDLDYIEKITMLLKNTIMEMGIEIKNEEISFRFLMGSILSFLYLPESNEQYINDFIDNILAYIVK